MLSPAPRAPPAVVQGPIPSGHPPGPLREWLTRAHTELDERLLAGEDGLALGRLHARLLDALLQRLFADAAKKTGVSGIGLAAVGSWGRGAVARKSDADVRVIVAPRADSREAGKFAEALLYPLWDLGISVGHQIVDEDAVLRLAQEDLSTATALLDIRHLAGDKARLDALLTRAWEGLFAEGELGAFIARLEEETAARHERYG